MAVKWRYLDVFVKIISKIKIWRKLFILTFAKPLGNPGNRKPIVLATSAELANNRVLLAVFGYPLVYRSYLFGFRASTYVGWGRKNSGKKAVFLSQQKGGKFLLAEDGFIRSIGREDYALSLVIDRLGIYYDATGPSDLERLIKIPLSSLETSRAQKLIHIWRITKISKYNSERDYVEALTQPYVLVVDQVKGDLSIEYGLADENSFQRMLYAALKENPNKTIVVKVHPDSITRSVASHFDLKYLEQLERVHVIAESCHPAILIENANTIYTVTSQVGFEALIFGKKVRTFGMPFYAGWGLTADELKVDKRREKVTLEQLVYAVLIKYSHYIDPITNQRCEVERIMDHIALQREKRLEFPNHVMGINFSRWKKPFIKYFLQGSDIRFFRKLPYTEKDYERPNVVWGNQYRLNLQSKKNVLRLEDGFLRSSGLGADLISPLSLIIDDVGIYYDSTRPSRLENILNQQILSQAQLARAAQLRKKIIDLKLTKYNVGFGAWKRPHNVNKVILVVGQVVSDASIEFGSPIVKSNAKLLKKVRADNANSYIIYKPHPDVIAKLRQKDKKEERSHIFCDEIIANLSIDEVFSQVDEVHTMTSLMGFEALMRGVKVICYGMPFYAGWGLTTDMLKCTRRNRNLSLDELVYGTLISYPRYFDYEKKIFIEPEGAVNKLYKLTSSKVQTRSWYHKSIRLSVMAWVKIRKHDRV